MAARSGPPRLRLWSALLCVAFAGCASQGHWHATRAVAPESLAADRVLQAARVDATAWPADGWWRSYGDPQLNELIDDALTANPSLQTAQARLQAAQAVLTRASGTRLPSTALSLQSSRQRYSENGLYPPPYAGNYWTDSRLALDLSYDIDFWGRNRELIQSAEAGARAAEADHAAARLALTVAVARTYFQLNLQYSLLEVTQANLTQQTAILDLTRQRAEKGLENVARVKQSEAKAALTRAGLEYTQANIELVQTELAALAGAGPDRGASLARPHLVVPESLALPSTVPAELLGRRPDIAAQRWRVESAAHGTAAAEAAFYPNVNLVAFAGLQSLGLSKLLNAGSAMVGAGPALSLPVFNRRELHGALQARQAEYDLSVSQYNQTLIDAISDVSNVVTDWQALEKESTQAKLAEEAAVSAYDITKVRYQAGLDNYLTVLSSENEVFVAQAVRAELLARRLRLGTDLVRALGGGYSTAPAGK